MVFLSKDVGPVGKSAIQQQSTKYDNDTGKVKKVKYKMSELVQKLKDENNVIAKGNMKKIQLIATNNNITLHHKVPIIEEGWIGKPKECCKYSMNVASLTQPK